LWIFRIPFLIKVKRQRNLPLGNEGLESLEAAHKKHNTREQTNKKKRKKEGKKKKKRKKKTTLRV